MKRLFHLSRCAKESWYLGGHMVRFINYYVECHASLGNQTFQTKERRLILANDQLFNVNVSSKESNLHFDDDIYYLCVQ